MALEEKTSKHLGIPYVYIPEVKKYLCKNGVVFTLEEYKNGIDLNAEYERREKEGTLYDYNYAKSTGLLRKKRGTAKTEEVFEKVQKTETVICNTVNDSEELRGDRCSVWNSDNPKSLIVICALLAFTSVISMYISTLHTATYLTDYVDVISAWLMSASVTAYNGTAFEVSVIFKGKKRYGLTFVFMSLWVFVTVFSMATTVSVFYDRFNFNESQIVEENKQSDSARLQLELLQKKESDLREAIAFKKKDIEYRQEREYATTAVRNELTKLESELQENLSNQQKIVESVPEADKSADKVQKKESLFTFLGRLMHLEGGILEFIMSTLSAIFVNLIAPLSLTAVIELLYKKEK